MHIMIDLETLSTRVNAVITQIGWCAFDPASEGVMWHESRRPNIPNQMYTLKRAVDWQALSWWNDQHIDARNRMYSALSDCTLESWLMEFAAAYNWSQVEGLWSHGASFDIPIIENAYHEANIPVPWKDNYWIIRDTRTIFWLAGMGKADLIVASTKHVAEDDAIAQALSVQKAFKIIDNARAAHLQQMINAT